MNNLPTNAKTAKAAVRDTLWRLLEKRAVARFPLPPAGRIPNFQGAEHAAGRLAATSMFQRARTLKVNPDAPQLGVRLKALENGKRVYMPTPRLRAGFILLDPNAIPRMRYSQACSIRGAFRFGQPVNLAALEPVDLVVMGSVAVSPSGARLGKGGGFSEIEYAVLAELGLLKPNTVVATTVHDLQVVEQTWPLEAHDVAVDVICTPTRTIEASRRSERPSGILWERITEEQIRTMPVLSELRVKHRVKPSFTDK